MTRKLEKALLASREKLAPAKWKVGYSGGKLRRFTMKERLLILLGYNLRCDIEVIMEHGPGRLADRWSFTITKAADAEEIAKEEAANL